MSIDDMGADIWERLSHPDCLTVAINKSMLYFNSQWWIVTDARALKQLVPRADSAAYTGTRLWNIKAVHDADEIRGIEFCPWAFGAGGGEFETERLDRIVPYASTESYCCQIFAGIMGADIYLVGVDHADGASGQTHVNEGRRVYTGGNFFAQPSPSTVEHSLAIIARWAKANKRTIVTCSPWEKGPATGERTIVRKHLVHMPFDEAYDRALATVAARRKLAHGPETGGERPTRASVAALAPT